MVTQKEYEFLVRSILGWDINLDDLAKENTEKIINACIVRADRDMMVAAGVTI